VSAWVDKRLNGDGDGRRHLVRYAYENGQALVNMAWGSGRAAEIGGTEGRVVMTNTDFGTHPFVPAARLDVVAESGSRSWTPRDAVAYGMAGIAADFRDAVATNAEPVANGESGLRVLDAVLGAYVSAALVAEVELPLPSDHPVLREMATSPPEPDASLVLRRGLFGVNQASA
jgi:predicted dehydrogenase